LLELVLGGRGAPAGPGGFSQRAFLNGRLDLTRAEAISELIHGPQRRAASWRWPDWRGDYGRIEPAPTTS